MTLIPDTVKQNYLAVRRRVEQACSRVGRDPAEVTVVAVSKRQPKASILAAMEAGCLDFGENRVQEWQEKQADLPSQIRWHFIGHLQRNKVRTIANRVAFLHSLDSLQLLAELEKRAQVPHDVLLEVNLGGEEAKSGVPVDEVVDVSIACAKSKMARLVGLMCIPPYNEDPEAVRGFYTKLAALGDQVKAVLRILDQSLVPELFHLSMGMTHDFEVAIEEGATMVRVGTAIFGPRRPHHMVENRRT